jgi:hypothetical protein
MRLLIILFLLAGPLNSFGQYDWNSKNWDKKSLGFACSYSGQPTVPVTRMTQLLAQKRIKEIREALNSKLTADQYLATFVLEALSAKGELELGDDELKRIHEIKSSNEMVPFCTGCVFWVELTLKQLFEDETHGVASVNAHYWFDRYYEIYYEKKKEKHKDN